MKILHTADWHFSKKVYEELVKCLMFLLNYAIKNKPDLFLISGDITDSKNLTLDSESARFIFFIINKMLDIAPVAIVIGTPSHDGHAALALRECRGKYPILVSDMPGQYIYDAGLDVASGNHGKWLSMDDIQNSSFRADFIITQIPQPTKQYFINDLSVEDNEKAIGNAMGMMFAAFGHKAALLNGVPHIANGHGQIGGAFISETQQLIGLDIEVSKAQLKTLNAELICYGHIHKAQDMGDGIFYAGSPTRTNHGEKEDKGFYIHTLDDRCTTQGNKSEFIQTPAIYLHDAKFDYTKSENNVDIMTTIESMCEGISMDYDEWGCKVTITAWQDDAKNINKSEIEKEIVDSGASRYPVVAIIRKPRESVRAEKVLEAETLPEKLEAMAELRGEKVSGSILEKATHLEAGDQMSWIQDVKKILPATVKDVKSSIKKFEEIVDK